MTRFPAIILALFLPFFLEASSGNTLVIPFFNASANPNLEWIGDSVAEAIRETLVSYQVPAFNREEREEASHHLSIIPGSKLTKASILKLAIELDATSVVYGELDWIPEGDAPSSSQGNVTLTAQMIDVEDLKRHPEIVESGPMAGLARIQTRLAWRVLRNALPRAPDEREFLETHPPVRIDAMESYVRGLLDPSLDRRHRYFAQAVRLDPEFAQPRFQLGRMHWEEQSYQAAAQWLESVSPSNPYYLEANFLLGLCRYHVGEYAGALAAFELVGRQAPFVAVWNNLGVTRFRLRAGGAVEDLEQAVRHDPMDADILFNLGYILWRQGDLDSAAERFRAVLELQPDDANAKRLLERCLERNGPRRGDLSSEGLERLKEDYEETIPDSL